MDITWSLARDLFAILGLPWAVINTVLAGRDRKRSRSPRLVFGDEYIEGTNPAQYRFITRNIGQGSAINVDIPQPFLVKYGTFLRAWKEIRRELGPGGATSCIESNVPILPLIEHLEMTYEDVEGHKCKTTYRDRRFKFEC